MEQIEADLIRDIIKSNHDEIVARLDAQRTDINTSRADIERIRVSIQALEKEYEAVLIEQKAAKLAAELSAKIAAEVAVKSDRNIRRLRNYLAMFVSGLTLLFTVVPYLLRLAHLG